MAMDVEKKAKVEEFIETNEQAKGYGKLAETVADLAGVEKETKEGFLSKWLKNDENLLKYAELTMKTEKLNFGESIKHKLLELKLSVTCPYFADFKYFLEELKRGTNTSTTNNSPNTTTTGNTETLTTTSTTSTGSTSAETASESSETLAPKFCGTNISSIRSEPFERNSRTGVTWCSKTARNNGKNFGIVLPSGNAYDAGKLPGRDSIQTIPQDKINKQPQKSWKGIEASAFKSITRGNYADIYVESKSNYGHRAAAFKGDNGQWYVLDPYVRVNNIMDNSPKKLEDYMRARKIVKAHVYESKGYLPDSQEVAANPKVETAVQWAIGIAEDNCHGYERGGKGQNGQYDCSGLVTNAFKQAGFNVPVSGTATMRENFTKAGFEWISPYDSSKLKRGDILLKDQGKDGERHTEIYTGNGKFVGARSNKDGRVGDSSGNEIAESSANWLTTFVWNGILRYKG